MNNERWEHLMHDDKMHLTAAEIAQGWHFCWEFDGLLVGPGMGEQRFCTEACGAPPTVAGAATGDGEVSTLPNPFTSERINAALGAPLNYYPLFQLLGPKDYVFANPPEKISETHSLRICDALPFKNVNGEWHWHIENIRPYSP